MKFNLLNRKIHYWATPLIAIPVLLIIVTGILLQTKKQLSWVQPTERRGSPETPMLTMPQVLEIAKSVSEAEVLGWDDIHRLDVRPSRGLLKVIARNHWEIQIDTHTGAVLQASYRRSDIIESIHDGSFFHESVKLWLYLPVAVALLGTWLTGSYLFLMPYIVRRRRKK